MEKHSKEFRVHMRTGLFDTKNKEPISQILDRELFAGGAVSRKIITRIDI